jgi:hypothetical protein
VLTALTVLPLYSYCTLYYLDPSETTNVAAAPENKAVVERLIAKLREYQQPLQSLASLPKDVLSAKYDKLSDPDKHWQGYKGPCYTRKAEAGGV